MSTLLLDPVNASSPPAVATRAPAKLNLTLDILGRRPDGYHDLRSLVIGVGLCDEVSCASQPAPGISIECSDPSLSDRSNLAVIAAELLGKMCGIDSGMLIRIEKRIPIGAGLGGGSSDAAATLRLCNKLWRTGRSDAELAAIGACVGSDVPLFFSMPSAVIEGRGERTRSVSMNWSGWALLIFPRFSVATADVYRAWRREDAGSSEADPQALCRATNAEQLTPLLSNQLEPAVFRVCPALAGLRGAIEDGADLRPLRVSGSGSTLYRLFDDQESARDAARRIQDRTFVSTFIAQAPLQTSWDLF